MLEQATVESIFIFIKINANAVAVGANFPNDRAVLHFGGSPEQASTLKDSRHDGFPFETNGAQGSGKRLSAMFYSI